MPKRPTLFVLFAFAMAVLRAQTLAGDPEGGVSYHATYNLPLNGLQMHDRALEAWNRTFGREPGAILQRNDREGGNLEGHARINYRSIPLVGREETMGTVGYRVVIRSEPGKCRLMVTDLKHTGNRNTMRGGVHFGRLTHQVRPAERIGGMGQRNAERIWEDIKAQSDAHMQRLLHNFGLQMRWTE